ncbi:uncharacterized protein LOC121651231 [Melanotaenia boesemani]|uniref:uncharacterized protein LOC121651231 n=1 Tax=Melanotaenia boesemani TaxID=1250792 RepID=UPI001C0583FD|nr:uncharacterized protein LOC121651231 [Melanotaenia boesemani]
MKTLCLIFLLHASLQLQCDKNEITAYIGGEFIITCKYDTRSFLFSKKYWCRGTSRSTCEILVDSEGVARTEYTHRSRVLDARRGGAVVKVSNLQKDDSGVFWIGIDKIYADVMISFTVVITEVPVSKPRLWPLNSLADKPTCWGKPVTVRCACEKGTGVQYAWYQHIEQKDFLLQHSSDLSLHCDAVERDSKYYCTAHNDVSSEESDVVSVQVLMPADRNCIYVINIQGQPNYDCADRMSTTTMTTPLTTCQAPTTTQSDQRDQFLIFNQTDQDNAFSRAWAGVPLWYTLLRWSSLASLLVILFIVHRCTKTAHKECDLRL